MSGRGKKKPGKEWRADYDRIKRAYEELTEAFTDLAFAIAMGQQEKKETLQQLLTRLDENIATPLALSLCQTAERQAVEGAPNRNELKAIAKNLAFYCIYLKEEYSALLWQAAAEGSSRNNWLERDHGIHLIEIADIDEKHLRASLAVIFGNRILTAEMIAEGVFPVIVTLFPFSLQEKDIVDIFISMASDKKQKAIFLKRLEETFVTHPLLWAVENKLGLVVYELLKLGISPEPYPNNRLHTLPLTEAFKNERKYSIVAYLLAASADWRQAIPDDDRHFFRINRFCALAETSNIHLQDVPRDSFRFLAIMQCYKTLLDWNMDPAVIVQALAQADQAATNEGYIESNNAVYVHLINKLRGINFSHRHLINIGKNLGYDKLSSQGICHGIVHMWQQAFLLGDEARTRFEKRLALLANSKLSEINIHILNAEEKFFKARKEIFKIIEADFADKQAVSTLQKNDATDKVFLHVEKYARVLSDPKDIDYKTRHQELNILVNEAAIASLSETEQLLLEVKPFYDGVAINQGPQEYPQLFPESNLPITQSPQHSIPLTASVTQEDQRGIKKIGAFSGIYDRDHLIDVLDLLRHEYQADPAFIASEHGICFLLGATTSKAESHIMAIGLCYNKQKNQAEWYFHDSNQLPSSIHMDEKEVVEYLLFALGDRGLATCTFTANSLYAEQASFKAVLDKMINEREMRKNFGCLQENASFFDNPAMVRAFLEHASLSGDVNTILTFLDRCTPQQIGMATSTEDYMMILGMGLTNLSILPAVLQFIKKFGITEQFSLELLNNMENSAYFLKNKEVIKNFIDEEYGFSLGDPTQDRVCLGQVLVHQAANMGYADLCAQLIARGFFPETIEKFPFEFQNVLEKILLQLCQEKKLPHHFDQSWAKKNNLQELVQMLDLHGPSVYSGTHVLFSVKPKNDNVFHEEKINKENPLSTRKTG